MDREELPEFDVRRQGRSWSREEIERKYFAEEHPDSPGRMELIEGKLFGSEGQRITMLGWMLEQVGADAAVRLGDPEVWRQAVEDLYREREESQRPSSGVGSKASENIRRGKEIYERRISYELEPEYVGEFAVIDTESGDYEVDPKEIEAIKRLESRRDPGSFYIVKVGYKTAHGIGARPKRIARDSQDPRAG